MDNAMLLYLVGKNSQSVCSGAVAALYLYYYWTLMYSSECESVCVLRNHVKAWNVCMAGWKKALWMLS